MNSKIRNHRDLDVWKKSMDLVEIVYKSTGDFPKKEIYGLTSQIRRSVTSIPSNIAEGAARSSSREFIQFLFIAMGSASELETQILIAQRLGYIENVSFILNEIEAIKKMLNGLIGFLKKKVTHHNH